MPSSAPNVTRFASLAVVMLVSTVACSASRGEPSARDEARARDRKSIDAYVNRAIADSRIDKAVAKRIAALNAHLPPGALLLGSGAAGIGGKSSTIVDINAVAAFHVPVWGYVYRTADGALDIAPSGTPPAPLTEPDSQIPLDAVVSPIGDAMGRPLAGSRQLLPPRPHEAEAKYAAAHS